MTVTKFISDHLKYKESFNLLLTTYCTYAIPDVEKELKEIVVVLLTKAIFHCRWSEVSSLIRVAIYLIDRCAMPKSTQLNVSGSAIGTVLGNERVCPSSTSSFIKIIRAITTLSHAISSNNSYGAAQTIR